MTMTMTMIFLFISISVIGQGPSAYGDIVSCARAASVSTRTCRAHSKQAKMQADHLAAGYSQKVEGKSVKQSADMMSEVTHRIGELYNSAIQSCNEMVSNCRQECSDSGGQGLASACGQEMGKYISQVSGGKSDVDDSHEGAQLSSRQSKDRDGSRSNETTLGKEAAEGSEAKGTSAFPSTAQGESSAAKAPAGKGGSTDPGTVSPKAFEESGASQTKDTSSSGPFARGLKQAVEVFCKDKKNAQCPSCLGSSDLSRATLESLRSFCSQSCMADPEFRLQLADRCREVIRVDMQITPGQGVNEQNLSGDSTSTSIGRNPSGATQGVALPSKEYSAVSRISPEVGTEFGFALFKINSQVLRGKCHKWRIRSCR